jgi:TonB family protein
MTSSAAHRLGFAGWLAATAAAVALHLLVAGAVYYSLSGDDPDPELGAPAIEIGVELAAPRGEASELPPGPDSDASAAAPESQASAAASKPADLPKDQPLETAEPDRQAAPETPPDPPKETETAGASSAASAPSLASEATATPKSPAAPDSTRSVAPAVGVGGSFARIRASWEKELVAHLNRFKRYPAGGGGESAEVVVDLKLDETGRVASASVLRSSGRPAFDSAALAMVRRADPAPRPPPEAAQAGLHFALPVLFRPSRGGR